MQKNILGWKEWCSLPSLGLPAIKAKIDTGAATSALHAFNIRVIQQDNKKMVRFDIHPVQNRKDIIKQCIAPLVGMKKVSDSGGHSESRYTIRTTMIIGAVEKEIDITLTNRVKMLCRMLVGREALRGDFLVDSEATFKQGNLSRKLQKQYYNI